MRFLNVGNPLYIQDFQIPDVRNSSSENIDTQVKYLEIVLSVVIG